MRSTVAYSVRLKIYEVIQYDIGMTKKNFPTADEYSRFQSLHGRSGVQWSGWTMSIWCGYNCSSTAKLHRYQGGISQRSVRGRLPNSLGNVSQKKALFRHNFCLTNFFLINYLSSHLMFYHKRFVLRWWVFSLQYINTFIYNIYLCKDLKRRKR
jgi:hypothetical protein